MIEPAVPQHEAVVDVADLVDRLPLRAVEQVVVVGRAGVARPWTTRERR